MKRPAMIAGRLVLPETWATLEAMDERSLITFRAANVGRYSGLVAAADMIADERRAALIADAKALEEGQDVGTARDCWKYALAFELLRVVHEWATRDEAAGLIAGTLGPDEMCDSNMAMAAAFERVMGRPEGFTDELSHGDADLALWNDAVEHANRHYFKRADVGQLAKLN